MKQVLHFLSALLLLLFAAGCLSVPQVRDPAPREETVSFLKAMDKAAGVPLAGEIRSFRLVMDGEIPENGAKLSMDCLCVLKPIPMFRVVLQTEGDPPVIQLFDGKRGWEITGDIQIREMEGQEVDSIREQALLSGPGMSLCDAFGSVAMEKAPVALDNVSCRRLVGRTAGGEWLELFVGSGDCLVRKLNLTTSTSLGRIPVSIHFRDYRNYAGLVMPAKQTWTILNLGIAWHIRSFEPNPPYRAEDFRPDPEEWP